MRFFTIPNGDIDHRETTNLLAPGGLKGFGLFDLNLVPSILTLPELIEGDTWPTSSNVNTTTSQFYSIQAASGKLKYKPFGSAGAVDAKPAYCNAASYIEYDTQGVAATAGFQVTDTSQISTAITTGSKVYELEFYFQLAKSGNFVANTTPADGTSFYLATIGNVYAGLQLIVQNSDTYGQGFLYRLVSSGIGGTPVEKGLANCEGTTAYYPAFKFDTWYRCKIRFKGGTSGYYQFWINGRIIGEGSGDMSGLSGLSTSFRLPAAVSTFPSGLVMRFTGPIKASNTTIQSIVNAKADPLDQHCVKDLPIRFQDVNGETRWSVLKSLGMTSTLSQWATTGVNPGRYTKSFSGAQGEVETWDSEKLYDTSTDDLDPFNLEGWCSIRVINFQMTGTTTRSTLRLQVYNSNNTAVDVDLTVNSAGNLINTSTGAVLFSSLAASNNYTLLIHISRIGEICLTLFDNSNTTFTSSSIRSAYYGYANTYGSPLTIGTNGIGKYSATVTLGDSGTPHLDGIQLMKWATIPIVDGDVHATANAVTPNLAYKKNIYLFRDAEEVFSTPGAFSPRVYGTNHDTVTGAIAARTGQSLSAFFSALSTAFTYSRGICVMQLCGIRNDSGTMTSSNYGTYVGYTTQLANSLINNGNRFWFASSPTPPGSAGSIPAAFQAAVPLYNTSVMSQLSTLGYLSRISDIASANPSLNWNGAGTTPDAAGCLALFRSMGATYTTSSLYATDSFSGDLLDLQNHLTDQEAAWIKNTSIPDGLIRLIGSGYISNQATGGSLYHPIVTPTSADYSTNFTISCRTGETHAMAGVRCSATAFQGYFGGYFSNAWRIWKVVNGTITTLASYTTILDTFRDYAVSFAVTTSSGKAELSLTVDGVQVGSAEDSVSVISSVGYPGLYMSSPGPVPTGGLVSLFSVHSVNDTPPAFGLTTTNTSYNNVVICDGDGLTYGLGTRYPGTATRYTYPAKLGELLDLSHPGEWLTVMNAKSSTAGTARGWSDMINGGASVLDSTYTGQSYNAYIVAMAGNQDILTDSDQTAQDILTQIQTYHTNRKVAGWDGVGICTLLPCLGSSYPTNFNDVRNQVNTMLKADPHRYCDFLVDLTANTDLNRDSSPVDSGLYASDKINPNEKGCEIIAELVHKALKDYIAAQAIISGGGTITDVRTATTFLNKLDWSLCFNTIPYLASVSVQRRNSKDVIVLKYTTGGNATTIFSAFQSFASTYAPDVVLTTNEVIVENMDIVGTRDRQVYPGTTHLD